MHAQKSANALLKENTMAQKIAEGLFSLGKVLTAP